MSVTETAAVRVPDAVGEKVTVMVQLVLPLMPVPQLLVSAKSVAFVPVIAMLVIDRFVPETSVRVTACEGLVVPTACDAKVRELGVSDTAVPVPFRVTVCVPSLSTMVSVAVWPFTLVGVKVTLMVQLAFEERALPQLLVCANSVALVPVIEMLEMVIDLGAELVSVTAMGALVVLMTWAGNVTKVGETMTGMFSSTAMMVLGAVGSPPITTAMSCAPSLVKAPAARPVG